MAKAFVRIPFNRGLEFPPRCPFTGQANPTRSVVIWYPCWRWRIPVPVLEWLWWEPTARFRLPAAFRVAIIESILKYCKIVMWLAVALVMYLSIVYQLGHENEGTSPLPRWYWLLSIGLAGSTILKFCQLQNHRAVRIADADGMSLELGFANEQFAKEFATLNNFICKPEPFKQRSRKVAGLPT